MEKTKVKQYAFISYSHKDIKMALWLQQKLESYKLPSGIRNKYKKSKYLRPVFRDKTDLGLGILSDEIRKELDGSQYLIVICSTYSSVSKWVNEEVDYFVNKLDRIRYVIPFVIDVEPESGLEKLHFPDALIKYIKDNPKQELLGVNIADGGKEKAVILTVSKIIGIGFEELWKRHERKRKKKLVCMSIATLLSIVSLYYLVFPITLSIQFVDEDHDLLMPSKAMVMINNTMHEITNIDTILVVANMPGFYRGKCITTSFSAQYYKTDTFFLNIGFGTYKNYYLPLHRDSSFSIFAGIIIDESGTAVKDACVEIDGKTCQTDSLGYFNICFPLERQSPEKKG